MNAELMSPLQGQPPFPSRCCGLTNLRAPFAGNTFVQDVGGYFRLLARTPQNLMERVGAFC